VRQVFALLLLAACNTPATTAVPGTLEMTGETVLTIDGKPISKDFIDALTSQIPPRQLDMMKQSGQFKDFVEQMATGQILYEKALAEKLYEDPKIKFKVAIAERDALIKEYMARVSASAVNDAALTAEYEKKASMFKRPQAQVRHILLKDQAEADAVLALVKGGGDFAAIATEKSQDKGSAVKGGDLGWISNGQISKEFSEAAFAAAPNDTVGPIQDRTGFHILQVTGKREAIPMEEVKDQLESAIKQESLKKLFDEVKAGAKIEWKIDPGGPAKTDGPPGMQLQGGPMGGPPPGGAPQIKIGPAGSPPGAPPAGAPASSGGPAAPAPAAPPAAPAPAAPPAAPAH
jgi:peptidyl-prolyl cis-trans isomerase C